MALVWLGRGRRGVVRRYLGLGGVEQRAILSNLHAQLAKQEIGSVRFPPQLRTFGLAEASPGSGQAAS